MPTQDLQSTINLIHADMQRGKEYTDNAVAGSAGVPCGTIIHNMFSDAPAGYLRADDPTIEYDRIIYNAIFTKLINDNWITNESGDASTTFNIPDFRGCFLRGYGENSATLGVKQLDSAPNITGFVGGWVGLNGGRYSASGAFQTNLANYGQYTDSRNDVCTGNSFDASRSSASYGRNNTTEVRPINYAIYYYIKY